MYRVIFVSDATSAISDAEITAMSLLCSRRNAEAGLTGLLLYHDQRFFSVLEGEPDMLQQTMGRILRDRRHRNVTLKEVVEIDRRAFVTWRIGMRLPDEARRRASAAIGLREFYPPNSDYRGRDPGVRDHVRAFLTSFRSLPRALEID